jgi:hypothetical protein
MALRVPPTGRLPDRNEAPGPGWAAVTPPILVVLAVSSSLLLVRKLSINGAHAHPVPKTSPLQREANRLHMVLHESYMNVYQGPSSSVTLAGNVYIFPGLGRVEVNEGQKLGRLHPGTV